MSQQMRKICWKGYYLQSLFKDLLASIKGRWVEWEWLTWCDVPSHVAHRSRGKQWQHRNRGWVSLLWRHDGWDDVSNHQPRDCLQNRLFMRRSKRTSKLCVTGLCAENSPVTGEFPAQKASNAENVSFDYVIMLFMNNCTNTISITIQKRRKNIFALNQIRTHSSNKVFDVWFVVLHANTCGGLISGNSVSVNPYFQQFWIPLPTVASKWNPAPDVVWQMLWNWL